MVMYDISDELQQLILDTDAEGGHGQRVFPFGARLAAKALGIDYATGDPLRIVIDSAYGRWSRVHVDRTGSTVGLTALGVAGSADVQEPGPSLDRRLGDGPPFGTREMTDALGIPEGSVVNRVLIDITHDGFWQVQVFQAAPLAEPERLVHLLTRLAPALFRDAPLARS